MGYLLTPLCPFAGLLAISGVALAADDFFNVPEPGVLELVVIAGLVSWVIRRKRGGK